MRRACASRSSAIAPDLLDAVSEMVGEDPFARVGEGTRFDQPAIFCAGLAAYERLGRPVPAFFAGHSLGELTALVAAGVLSEDDGLRLVALRGMLSDQAAERSKGGMLVLRTGRDVACCLAERSGLAVANDNAPEQVVLSGPDAALRAGEQEAESAGLRAKRLPVAGAFHSPAMRPAVPGFGEAAVRDAAAQGQRAGLLVRDPRALRRRALPTRPGPDQPRSDGARRFWPCALPARAASSSPARARPWPGSCGAACPTRRWSRRRSSRPPVPEAACQACRNRLVGHCSARSRWWTTPRSPRASGCPRTGSRPAPACASGATPSPGRP